MAIMTDTEKFALAGDIFRKHLYSKSNIPEIAEAMGNEISETFDDNDFLFQSLASQLVISSDIRKSSSGFYDISNQISEAAYNLISNHFPEVLFAISGRRKSFESELHKRFEKISEGNTPIIKDLLAIRIIIINETSPEILEKLYRVFLDLVTSLTKVKNTYLNFPLEISEPDRLITSSSFKPEEYPQIILPDENSVTLEKVQRISKDYIRFPKPNGYQSLHGSFIISSTADKYAGLNLEIQIRTLQQHIWAEQNENASHSAYKKSRGDKMNKIFYFDPKKVLLPGYADGIDLCGLSEAIPLCQRQKTF